MNISALFPFCVQVSGPQKIKGHHHEAWENFRIAKAKAAIHNFLRD